mmetsp:Transcript_11462/g.26665  ORF Transcript_11462/g.26665 Transcript_11462/m.26665 type:complete len:127 (+) Transcript_11462:367-747(+)
MWRGPTSTLQTTRYVAPEVVAMEPYGLSVDIWSLGSILFELITGERPYGELNAIAAMFHVVQNGGAEVPDSVARGPAGLIGECWQRDAERRPTAAELLERASLWPNAPPATAPRPVPPTQRDPPAS